MSKSQLYPLGYESKIAHLSTGHYYRYADIHPPENVKTIATALLLHGFPDSAAAHNESASYGWRHQIKGWTSRGIRLIIPDTLGYYGSSQPSSPEDYSTKRQSDDLEELVRYAGVPKEDKIIIISHDWGSVTAGRLIQFKPDLVKAAAVFCVPFFPPSPQYIPLEKFSEQFPNMEYQVFLASPESTAILDANAERFIRLTYTSARQRDAGEVPSLERAGVIEGWLKDESKDVVPELLSQEELTTILSEIKAGKGFGAMLNYYRVGQINYEAEKGLPHDVRPDLPKLIVTPSADPFLPPAVTQYAQTLLKNVDVVWLDGLCGHWVQLEKPQEIEKIVGDSQPTSLEDYSTQRQSDDLEELVHRAGVPKGEKIVVIAHDCLCVPFIPRSPEYVPLEKLIELYPNFQYQAFLASRESTAITNANVERFIQVMFTSAKQREEGKVPDLEKTGVIKNWLKDQSQTVTSELLTKEESDTMVDEIKAGVGFGYVIPLLY
ncbi:hypothetical protein RhiTH_010974 [Rhizoctonia solani]